MMGKKSIKNEIPQIKNNKEPSKKNSSAFIKPSTISSSFNQSSSFISGYHTRNQIEQKISSPSERIQLLDHYTQKQKKRISFYESRKQQSFSKKSRFSDYKSSKEKQQDIKIKQELKSKSALFNNLQHKEKETKSRPKEKISKVIQKNTKQIKNIKSQSDNNSLKSRSFGQSISVQTSKHSKLSSVQSGRRRTRQFDQSKSNESISNGSNQTSNSKKSKKYDNMSKNQGKIISKSIKILSKKMYIQDSIIIQKIQLQQINKELHVLQTLSNQHAQQISSRISDLSAQTALKIQNFNFWSQMIVSMMSMLYNNRQNDIFTKKILINRLIEVYDKANAEIFYQVKIKKTKIVSTNTDFSDVNEPLITYLIQLIILNFNQIGYKDLHICTRAFLQFRQKITKITSHNLASQFSPSNLIGFYESNLKFLDFIFQKMESIKLNEKKDKLEGTGLIRNDNHNLLWKYIEELAIILKHVLTTNFSNNIKVDHHFRSAQMIILQISYNLITQLTHFVKKYKIEYFNLVDFNNLFQLTINKVIELNSLKLLQVQKDSQKKSKFQLLKLPLYDWGILSIKNNPEQIFFQNIFKYCRKNLSKGVEKSIEPSNRPIQRLENRFSIINEDPQELDISVDNISNISSRKSHKFGKYSNRNKNISEDLDKDKKISAVHTILSHINFLSFRQHFPRSYHLTLNNNQPLSKQKKNNSPTKLKSKTFILKKPEIFTFLIVYKQYILKILEFFEYIETEFIPPEISTGLIQLAKWSYEFKSLQKISELLKELQKNNELAGLLQRNLQNDETVKKRMSASYHQRKRLSVSLRLGQHFNHKIQEDKNQQLNNSLPYKVQYSENQVARAKNEQNLIIVTSENLFYEYLSQVEKKLPCMNLNHYLYQLIKIPEILRGQVYYQKLLIIQPIIFAREYLIALILEWIDNELRFFNILDYYQRFIQHCFKCQQQKQILLLIEKLPIEKCSKFHLFLFKETFEDHHTPKILNIIEPGSQEERINRMTSGGLQTKARFIDKYFPNIAEIILWREYLQNVSFINIGLLKFINIKVYFTLIVYYYSINRESKKLFDNIGWLIQKFKNQIQKDKVDDVAATFHFLSLALIQYKTNRFNMKQEQKNQASESQKRAPTKSKPHSLNTINQSIQKEKQRQLRLQIQHQYEKFIQEILFILRDKYQAIVKMFDVKENITMKILSDMMSHNRQGFEQQRKEVGKSLNKSKNMHIYFLKSIIRFIQSINYNNPLVLKNFQRPDQFMSETILENYLKCTILVRQDQNYINRNLHAIKCVKKLSQVSSRNFFEQIFKKELNKYKEWQTGSGSIGKVDFYLLLTIVRQITIEWEEGLNNKNLSYQQSENIEFMQIQKNQKINTKRSHQLDNPSKFSKTMDNRKSFRFGNSSSALSLLQIFNISLKVLNIELNKQDFKFIRQQQIIRWKLLAGQILKKISNIILTRCDQISAKSADLVKEYHQNGHQKLGRALIEIAMNNNNLISRNQLQLTIHFRLFVIQWLICNFQINHFNSTNNSKFNPNFFPSFLHFWFAIYTLAFDKALQIRFLLVNYSLSRFKNPSNTNCEFKSCKPEIISLYLILSALEPNRYVSSMIKQKISILRSSIQYIPLLLSSLMGLIHYLINLNTIYILQTEEKKLSEKQIFTSLVDILFEHHETQAYLNLIIEMFKKGNWQEKLVLIQFNYLLKVDFYAIAKPDSLLGKSKIEMIELLNEMREQSKEFLDTNLSFSERYPKCDQIFKRVSLETIQILLQCLKARCACSHKKILRTKKSILAKLDHCALFKGSIILDKKRQENHEKHKKKGSKQLKNKYDSQIDDDSQFEI